MPFLQLQMRAEKLHRDRDKNLLDHKPLRVKFPWKKIYFCFLLQKNLLEDLESNDEMKLRFHYQITRWGSIWREKNDTGSFQYLAILRILVPDTSFREQQQPSRSLLDQQNFRGISEIARKKLVWIRKVQLTDGNTLILLVVKFTDERRSKIKYCYMFLFQ